SEPRDVRAADALAATPPGQARDRTLLRWAAHATLADLLYVLRRPASDLGGAEGPLVEMALARAPAERRALGWRLLARLAPLSPERLKKPLEAFAGRDGDLAARPRASVFRVGTLLPDSGPYLGYGRAVRLGLETALAEGNAGSERPIE